MTDRIRRLQAEALFSLPRGIEGGIEAGVEAADHLGCPRRIPCGLSGLDIMVVRVAVLVMQSFPRATGRRDGRRDACSGRNTPASRVIHSWPREERGACLEGERNITRTELESRSVTKSKIKKPL